MMNKLELVKRNIANHGISNASYQVLLKLFNKVIFVNVLTCIVISKIKNSSLEIDEKFEHGFLDEDKLKLYSDDKENELAKTFLDSSITKGDKCYALTEEGKLASYGWYSNAATLTDVQKLTFCFDPSFIYMYKGLTKKEYRGMRLHGVGMTWALKRYLEKGFNGIISYVDSTNFDSLKSCWRMGYKPIGNIYIFKIFGKVFHFSSPACRQYKVRLKI